MYLKKKGKASCAQKECEYINRDIISIENSIIQFLIDPQCFTTADQKIVRNCFINCLFSMRQFFIRQFCIIFGLLLPLLSRKKTIFKHSTFDVIQNFSSSKEPLSFCFCVLRGTKAILAFVVHFIVKKNERKL